MDVKDLLVTNVDQRVARKEAMNQYAYYVMIAIIALLATFVPPLIIGGIKGDFGLAFPETVSGWIVWAITQTASITANISILVFFKLQAKKNSLQHPNYIKACEILDRLAKKKRVYIPRSPGKMNTQDYTKKVIFITIFTLASFIAVGSIIITFDILSLISTLISMTSTLVLSWSCMLNNEEYWTREYLMYAEYMQEMAEESLKQSEKEESIIEGEKENA